MAKKVTVRLRDQDGKVVCDFTSKTLGKYFGKTAQGTPVAVSFDEKGFQEQYVGDYVIKGIPDDSTPPDPPHQCPDGEHWDDAQGKCVPDVVTHDCPAGTHWDEASQSCVPDTQPPVGDHDEFGTLMLHPVTGNKVEMEVGGDPAGNGQRYNCDHKFKDYMMIGYYKTGKGQEQIEMKTDGPHHGGHTANTATNTWTEPDLMLADGAFRISSEHPHPVNHKEGATGIKVGKIDQEWIGYAVVAYQDGEFRHLEEWYARNPFDANGKPTNNWVKGIDVVDTGQICNIDGNNPDGAKRAIPPSNGEVMEAEIRMHKTQANHQEPNGTDMKWCRVYELKPI